MRSVFKQLLFHIAICSTSTASALAQADANYDPKLLQAVHSLDTPEKLANVLRDKFHISLSGKWPTNFPLPVYNSNVIQTSFCNSTKGQPTAGATLITKDQPQQVFDFYLSACRQGNWQVKLPSAKARADLHMPDDLFFLTADRDNQTMSLTFTRDRKSNGTVVSITWQKKR